ncbi:MAG TPA: metal ABC transporter permease [Gemmatimonadaceae bacterium]|nr:metal ABC transporter permease [Gemmatimonadaceae bacterium]
MSLSIALRDLLLDPTLRTVSLGSAALGVVSGGLGAFAVLRKQSLLGDAISHAALPGIALAFLLTGSKDPLVLVLGAAAAGWLGTLLVMAIVRQTRIKEDTALGLVLSVFFGVGLMLLTFLQHRPDAAQAGLDRFLFGQAATMLQRDVAIIVWLGVGAYAVALFFWKEIKLLAFDPEFGASLGIPMRAVDVVLTSVLVIAVVVGLQTVGVVLMAAMIVAPGAAARQWTDRLGVMVVLSGAFGATAGVAGAVLSATGANLPTGPMIVLCLTAIAIASLTLAPNRGLVWAWVRQRRSRRQLRVEATLLDLYAMAAQHEDPGHAHSSRALAALGRGDVPRTLEQLAARGHTRHLGADQWALTQEGRAEARRLLDEQRVGGGGDDA